MTPSPKPKHPPVARAEAGLRKQLDLLSRTGAGIPALAEAMTPLVQQIIGADECVMVWVDAAGMPLGAFSGLRRPDMGDLYANEYRRLFVGRYEMNAAWLANQKGAVVGHLMRPDKEYFRSNTFNLLLKSMGLRAGLDLRVEVNGVTRLVVVLFRAPPLGFTEADSLRLFSLLPDLQRTAAVASDADGLAAGPVRIGHLLVSGDGEHVEMVSDEAVAILRSSMLVGQEIRQRGALRRPPLFVRMLCADLQCGPGTQARTVVQVMGGACHLCATWMGSGAERKVLITLEHRKTQAVAVARAVFQLDLSPLQGHIAMFAARGGKRSECAASLHISNDALKKHLRSIYAATGADEWGALTQTLVACPR